jgi:hypothetical protein
MRTAAPREQSAAVRRLGGVRRVTRTSGMFSAGPDGEGVEVVGEERAGRPGSRAVVAFETRSLEAVAAFEVTDAASMPTRKRARRRLVRLEPADWGPEMNTRVGSGGSSATPIGTEPPSNASWRCRGVRTSRHELKIVDQRAGTKLLGDSIAAGGVRCLPSRTPWPMHRAVRLLDEEAGRIGRLDVLPPTPVFSPCPETGLAAIGGDEGLRALVRGGVIRERTRRFVRRSSSTIRSSLSVVGADDARPEGRGATSAGRRTLGGFASTAANTPATEARWAPHGFR